VPLVGHSPCRICGYDLIGRAVGSRCPECGARVVRSDERRSIRGRIKGGDMIAAGTSLAVVLTAIILQRRGHEGVAIVVVVTFWVLAGLVCLFCSAMKKWSSWSRSARPKE
jgi:hypothetical protein